MASNPQHRVLVDYQSSDYRGFLFVVHNEYGLLLLHCTRKKNKPPHWQLPGGHVDDFEFLQAATAVHPPTRTHQLLHAGKSGASRELYEETGIDVRNQLDRIAPVHLQRSDTKTFKDGTKLLPNEYKQRLFFLVQVTDQDFAKPGQGVHAFGIGEPDCKYKHIQLNLSVEHSGFTFQSDPAKIVDMLQHHSGGKVVEAFRMAIRDPTKTTTTTRNALEFRIASESLLLQEETTIAAAPMEEFVSTQDEKDQDLVSRKHETPNDYFAAARGEEDEDDDHVPGDKTSRSLDIPPKREVRSKFCCC